MGWENYCSVFRLALCRGKRYGPNITLGTAKRLHQSLYYFQLLSEGRFICQNSRAFFLLHLFIAVSHVFSPTPLRLALLRYTHFSRALVYFISKILCSEAGSITSRISSVLEMYAGQPVPLVMKEFLVTFFSREDISILLLSIS
jgi:hypothetical protein